MQHTLTLQKSLVNPNGCENDNSHVIIQHEIISATDVA